jgi:hypothetical protein
MMVGSQGKASIRFVSFGRPSASFVLRQRWLAIKATHRDDPVDVFGGSNATDLRQNGTQGSHEYTVLPPVVFNARIAPMVMVCGGGMPVKIEERSMSKIDNEEEERGQRRVDQEISEETKSLLQCLALPRLAGYFLPS